MKIVGFTQHRNELSNGNLHNWLRCIDEVCEKIYVWDNASDDGSLEVLRAHTKVVLIENPLNDFANENRCKSTLLTKLLQEQPDADWILWADCDYVFRTDKILSIAETHLHSGTHGLSFGHYNLWRSDIWYRTDLLYHASHEPGRVSLWRNTGELRIDPVAGLHKSPLPLGLDHSKFVRVPIDLVHRGFATDKQILNKYNLYKSMGQSGWELNRLIDEQTLAVKMLPRELLPSWYKINDILDPKMKKFIKDIR